MSLYCTDWQQRLRLLGGRYTLWKLSIKCERSRSSYFCGAIGGGGNRLTRTSVPLHQELPKEMRFLSYQIIHKAIKQ